MNEALNNLLTRRACRKYSPDQIADDKLDAILEAGMYAPTGMGKQTPLIVVLQDPEVIKKVEKMNAEVMNMPEATPFYGAPTVVIVFAKATTPFGFADAHLVIGNLMNGANAVGVDSCYVWRAQEVFEMEEGKALKEAWGIPENYQGAGNVILGYGLPKGKREAAPRKEGYVIRV